MGCEIAVEVKLRLRTITRNAEGKNENAGERLNDRIAGHSTCSMARSRPG